MRMLTNENTQFNTPVKRIFDSQCTLEFQASVAIVRLKYFIQKYAKIINRVNIPQGPSRISVVNEFVGVLNHMSLLVDQTPPLEGPRRYGNLACRDWHAKIDEQMPSLWRKVLPDRFHHCIVELVHYLGNSFGSATRLDYGTGHELSFLAVVGAIDMLGLFTDEFQGEDFLLIMNAYYAVVRKLILTYTLEPAGSHGVWGLDDHFHLAYVFGSAQWANYKEAPLRPRDILNHHLVQEYAHLNLYCQTIGFIYQVKRGPFREHSSMLYDLATTVHTWAKLESGLMKMYAVEVLNKFPVVQHFWFGTGFYPWVDNQTGKQLLIYDPADADRRNTSSTGGKYAAFVSSINSPVPHFPAPSTTAASEARAPPARTRMGPPTARTTNSTAHHDLTKR
ncbi:ZYRO0B16478p [Zygosaccharomyces rouxii]|uniref:Serine/threonine-protein phosphatase 2A activator n=2 Tax=Zygosaccharomyces rouxii TaxID=4956 RepID=C5DSF6_ZYGRC|nr:uncharacterized protein ZYRO0B16478g [Zygosaccharomyces rouxii]KAH9199753.1 Phosphotyrosyl phosphate activator protein-domain-containing protein [Zygosaccharomyces rouxii]CAR26717.1 ZYRO0B16478p [Zygosaccharomyces rouxii]